MEDFLTSFEEPRIDNFLSRIEYYFNKKTKIALYGVYRFDRSPDEDRPFILGIHSSGEILKGWRYWSELAYATGHEKRKGSNIHYSGVGLDVGSTYRLDLPLKPTFIAGFAFGSGGGDSENSTLKGFRQTGLQDNSAKLTGVAPVKYYGELFDPELSNLIIYTAGLGIRPLDFLSVEFIYHHYLQHHADGGLLSSDLDSRPSGKSRDLGNELDLVLGVQKFKEFGLKASFCVFLPGKAFLGASDPAYFIGLKLQRDF